MNRARFEFALRQLEDGDWERFEHLAASFIASEYASLRTTASPSGDEGRDGFLYSPAGNSSVVLQYSITRRWENKIRHTVKRLNENFKDIRVLVYVTNQEIGSKGD